MAVARGPPRRGGSARRTALYLTFGLAAVVLVTVLSRQMPSYGGYSVIGSKQTADQVFQLAQASKSTEEFASRLQQAGLMAAAAVSSASSDTQKASKQAAAGSAKEPTDDATAGSSDSKDAGDVDDSGNSGKKYKVPQLSRELAHKHARDDIIIVTWANFHFSDFVLNWVHHVRAHGIENYLVGAMDADTGQLLASRGLNVFAMYDEHAGEQDTGLGKEDFGWGSPTFHKMGRQKVDLARTFNDYGLDLCLCDVDTVWINDPTEYFERFPEADILASSDDLTPSNPKGDDGLEQLEAIHSAMNIGLLFFRHGKNTTTFIDAWQQQLDADSKAWDQNVFNQVAHRGLVPFQSPPTNPRLVYGANHSLVFGVLPVAQFASGHTFFVQRLFEYQQVKPYVVHCTFQYGGTSGKRHRLREAMLWVDPPEYYSEGPFLSVDLKYPTIPKDFQIQDEFMMEGQRFKTDWTNDDMIEYHLKALKEQLLQVKTAFKLAVALNRTIIMPKLLSFCDRYWGPVEFCQLPGAFKVRLPFVAPLDHIFEPYHFNDGKGLELGPKIQFREYSFLLNERTPKKLKNTMVYVTPSASAQKAEERKEGGTRFVTIPEKPTDKQLRELLAPYKDVKLLHFSELAGAFGKFEDKEATDRFQHRINHMMGFFCCKKVKEGEDGGVSYVPMVSDPST